MEKARGEIVKEEEGLYRQFTRVKGFQILLFGNFKFNDFSKERGGPCSVAL